jgi:glycosyltransferase involved in cell wall biosynthesis
MRLNPLTILHINKFHHIIGGAELVYFRTARILDRYGHKSLFFTMRHPNNVHCETEDYFVPLIDIDSDKKAINYLKATTRNLYSLRARGLVSKLLDKYNVDIVHIHDMHRQMSPSVLLEFRKRNIPVVMTLHNYKMICPSFLMMTQNKPCEACNNARYFNALKLRCVKGSFPRSGLISLEAYLHHKILDIYRNVDIFIAPSMFLKRKHEEMGFHKKIVHLPYPLDTDEFRSIQAIEAPSEKHDKITFVFFGRLEVEKGLFTLVEALGILSQKINRKNYQVKIIGDGSQKRQLKDRVQRKSLREVTFIDFLEGNNLYREVKSCTAVILPSEWYENYPVSVMETFALAKPVIGSRIGGIPEMVKDNDTGLTFEPGNPVDLSEKIKSILDKPEKAVEMGKKARLFIEQEVNPDRHYHVLMEIYKEAISFKSQKAQ